MQGKKNLTLRITQLSIAILLTCLFSLSAKEKESQEKEQTGKDKSNGAVIFDSCGKEKAEKCDRKSEIKVPDYSKSLK